MKKRILNIMGIFCCLGTNVNLHIIIIIIMVYREQNSTHPLWTQLVTRHINIIIISINNGMVYSDIS